MFPLCVSNGVNMKQQEKESLSKILCIHYSGWYNVFGPVALRWVGLHFGSPGNPPNSQLSTTKTHLRLTLTLRTAIKNWHKTLSGSWVCTIIFIPSFIQKCIHSILLGQIFPDYLNPHCELGRKDSNPKIFTQNSCLWWCTTIPNLDAKALEVQEIWKIIFLLHLSPHRLWSQP